MPRKLRIDSIKAELSTIKAFLREANEIGDFVGSHQYEFRKTILEKELKELGNGLDSSASVAMFFGGKPVFGSKGVKADFASSVISAFQNIVTRIQVRETIGEIGARGKIPEIGNSDLMITEIAKGSFGFILEEINEQLQLTDTTLKKTVDTVTNIIEKTGGKNDDDFDEVLSDLDVRSLISLRDFFSNMEKHQANLRIVEGDKEIFLNEEEIIRGKIRTEATKIEENSTELTGILVGFLPEHRKFELRLDEKEVIYGSVSKEGVERYIEITKQGKQLIDTKCVAVLDVRIVTPLNHSEKLFYRLLDLKSST